MSGDCNAKKLCKDYSFKIGDKAIIENTDTSFNIYGLNSSSVIARKKFSTQLKCADLKRMTQVQKYAYEAKGYILN